MTAEKANDDRELDRLIDRMCDQVASVDELAALGHRLADDPAARDYYIACLELHARLAWQMTSGKPFSPEELPRYASEDREQGRRGQRRGASGQRRGLAGSPASDLPVGTAVELPSGQWPRTPNPEPPFPALSTTHYPLPTSFVDNPAFPYIAATVILGVGILVAWVCKVNHHQHIAEAPAQSVPSRDRPEMVFVGRITGMVDVKWSDDPRYLPPPGFAHVPLGRKYKLTSGLLEITYDTGAKVILEGPCTYEVESTAGGYLALGKLTARIGERGEGREESAKPQAANQKSEIRNQKSPSYFILHPSSLFSVRTPTAIITDLGTEFGVEVDNSGCSLTHVFQGEVEVRLASDGNGQGDAIHLAENESVRVDEKGWKRDVEAGNKTGDTESFVRLMPAAPKPSPVKVLAWFRMGDDDPDAAVGAVVNEETVDHKGRCKLVCRGEPVYSAGEESMGGRFSVRFHGLKGEGFFGSDALAAIRDDFIIEAWVKVHKFVDSSTKAIVYNGRPSSDGFGLIVRKGRWHYMFGNIGWFDSGVPVELGEWTHVALVYQWGSGQLWVNGRPAGELVASWRLYPPEGTFFIGGESGLHLSTDAEIDEVRLSVLLERFRPEMLLYPVSSVPRSPAGSDDSQGKNSIHLPKKETNR